MWLFTVSSLEIAGPQLPYSHFHQPACAALRLAWRQRVIGPMLGDFRSDLRGQALLARIVGVALSRYTVVGSTSSQRVESGNDPRSGDKRWSREFSDRSPCRFRDRSRYQICHRFGEPAHACHSARSGRSGQLLGSHQRYHPRRSNSELEKPLAVSDFRFYISCAGMSKCVAHCLASDPVNFVSDDGIQVSCWALDDQSKSWRAHTGESSAASLKAPARSLTMVVDERRS